MRLWAALNEQKTCPWLIRSHFKMIYGIFYPLSKNNPTASQAKNDSQTILTSLQLCNVHYIPCELRFFSCMAFSVNEVVRAAFQSRGKATQERNLCSQSLEISFGSGGIASARRAYNYTMFLHINCTWQPLLFCLLLFDIFFNQHVLKRHTSISKTIQMKYSLYFLFLAVLNTHSTHSVAKIGTIKESEKTVCNGGWPFISPFSPKRLCGSVLIPS